MHYQIIAETDEGLYKYRLYSVPRGCEMMHDHYNVIRDVAPVDVSEEAVAIDKIASSASDEFHLDQDQFDNIKLTLAADPIFFPVISAVRSTDEIWLEVVLEQHAPDLPNLQPGIVIWPRKTRLVWWGVAIHKDTKGRASDQDMVGEGGSVHVRKRQNDKQNGTLELNFKHWTQYYALGKTKYGSIKDVLDQFIINNTPDPGPTDVQPKVRASQLMYDLLRGFMPCSLFAIADTNLDAFDTAGELNPNDPLSISRANVSLPMELQSATKKASKLANVGFRAMIANGVSGPSITYGNWALFSYEYNDDGSLKAGDNSFYRWENFLSGITDLGKEFKLNVQFELPTLEEQYGSDDALCANAQAVQRSSGWWPKCGRVLFTPMIFTANMPPTPVMQYTPLQDLVEYEPCGSIVKYCKCKQPLRDDMYTLDGEVELGFSDSRAFETAFDEGQDVEIDTLLRFASYNKTHTHSEYGFELYVIDDAGAGELATSVVHGLVTGFEETDFDWSRFHCATFMSQWGGFNSIVELDFEGVGLERFGTTSSPFGTAVSTPFGLYDWSEFPLGRRFKTEAGLLPAISDEPTYFQVMAIAREPDGNGHIKAIHHSPTSILGIASTPTTDPPDDPPEVDPPTVTPPTGVTENFCGVKNFVFGVVFDGSICGVDIQVDGSHIPAFVAGVPGPGGHITAVGCTIDGCALTVGSHSIQVTVIPCDGSTPTTEIWAFTVNHSCCSGSTAKYLHT